MFNIGLNTNMRDNYAFFCPETRLHLTLTNPVGSADRVSAAIRRGLNANTLIDLDGVIDLKQDNGQQPGQDTKNNKKPENKEPEQKPDNKEPENPENKEPENKEPEQKPDDSQNQEPIQEPAKQNVEPEPDGGDLFAQLGAEAPVDPAAEKKTTSKKNSGGKKAAKAAE